MKNIHQDMVAIPSSTPKEKKFSRIHDGKGKFYYSLKLDPPTMKIIHWYRKLKYKIDRNLEPDAS